MLFTLALDILGCRFPSLTLAWDGVGLFGGSNSGFCGDLMYYNQFSVANKTTYNIFQRGQANKSFTGNFKVKVL